MGTEHLVYELLAAPAGALLVAPVAVGLAGLLGAWRWAGPPEGPPRHSSPAPAWLSGSPGRPRPPGRRTPTPPAPHGPEPPTARAPAPRRDHPTPPRRAPRPPRPRAPDGARTRAA